MQKATQTGGNRTGMQSSPSDAAKMLKQAKGAKLTPGDDSGIIELRTAYIEGSGPVGSVPPPASAKGAVKSGAKALTGKFASVFIDRLGERLAFERAGTRLYQAVITKCKADGQGKRYLQELEHFCDEELSHFRLVAQCIEQLGGDPTAQTPSADVAGMEGAGLMQVVTDPMTSVTQSLHALLVAELTDNAAWDELIELAKEMNQDDMASRFGEAQQREREHLEKVRAWHREATLSESSLMKA